MFEDVFEDQGNVFEDKGDTWEDMFEDILGTSWGMALSGGVNLSTVVVVVVVVAVVAAGVGAHFAFCCVIRICVVC